MPEISQKPQWCQLCGIWISLATQNVSPVLDPSEQLLHTNYIVLRFILPLSSALYFEGSIFKCEVSFFEGSVACFFYIFYNHLLIPHDKLILKT